MSTITTSHCKYDNKYVASVEFFNINNMLATSSNVKSDCYDSIILTVKSPLVNCTNNALAI